MSLLELVAAFGDTARTTPALWPGIGVVKASVRHAMMGNPEHLVPAFTADLSLRTALNGRPLGRPITGDSAWLKRIANGEAIAASTANDVTTELQASRTAFVPELGLFRLTTRKGFRDQPDVVVALLHGAPTLVRAMNPDDASYQMAMTLSAAAALKNDLSHYPEWKPGVYATWHGDAVVPVLR